MEQPLGIDISANFMHEHPSYNRNNEITIHYKKKHICMYVYIGMKNYHCEITFVYFVLFLIAINIYYIYIISNHGIHLLIFINIVFPSSEI